MARSEKNDTSTQSPASSTTSSSTTEVQPSGTSAPTISTPATVTASTSSAVSSMPTEAELRERERQLEERMKLVELRERELDSKDTQAKLAGSPPSAVPSTDSAVPTLTVLNNAAFAIGLYDGAPLKPGINEVPLRSWAKFFQKDGTVIPGARPHFEPANGGRPDLQVVSLDNVSALPDPHALTAISNSKDAQRLGDFARTESRPAIREAIKARLKELQTQDEKKK